MRQILAWWQGRDLREQWLIAILGTLVLIVVYTVLILGPIQARSRQARQDYDRAYDQAAALVDQVEQIEAAAARGAPSPQNRMSIKQALAVARLPSSKLIEDRGGLLRLTLEDVDATQLNAWIAKLSQQTGGQIESLQIQRSGSGQVSAVLSVRQVR